MKLHIHIELDSADPVAFNRMQLLLRTLGADDAMTRPDASDVTDTVEPIKTDREVNEPTASAVASPRRRAPRRAPASTNGANTSEPTEAVASTLAVEDIAVEDSPEPETATEDAITALREQLTFEWRRVATGFGAIRARDLATSIVNSGRIVPNAEAVPDVALDETLAAFQSVT